ncbi:MAG: OmpA family protein [Sedimentisphaerales bacterium]|nr:OmpA family protein [Sedimentisphaerales bacterium]
MQVVKARVIVPLIGVVALSLLSGCTDYKRKYDYLNVEHQNLKGRFENLESEKQQLAARISQDQQTINELRRQIEELNKTPAEATGFGEGYDVAFDAAAGTITVTLPNTILFDSGKAELKSATSAELDHILSVLKSKYAGKQIDVVGHTDTDPIAKTKDLWKDNWELSSERALSVTRYLMDHGIPGSQIKASGCGPDRPIAPNTTAAGKAKNRRVEIVVHMRE